MDKIEKFLNKIILDGYSDPLRIFRELPDESIDCIVTSPPYWGLRNYNNVEKIWDENSNCPHQWESLGIIKTSPLRDHDKYGGFGNTRGNEPFRKKVVENKSLGNNCVKCGAWKGQLGLEPTFDLYINHLCDIFDEIKRVLKSSGTCWVNIGDTYASAEVANYPSKCLCGIPFRFALEMINRGWILRNTIIWHKPNAMPSSVKDRFSVDFEYIFFFVKNQEYFFEQQYEPFSSRINKYYKSKSKSKSKHGKYGNLKTERICREGMHSDRGKNLIEKRYLLPNQENFVRTLREHFTIEEISEKCSFKRTKVEHWFRFDNVGFSYPSKEDWQKVLKVFDTDLFKTELTTVVYETDEICKTSNGNRIKRCVWSISTKGYKGAHFAVFPEALIETPIKAGCPEFICKKCGKFKVKSGLSDCGCNTGFEGGIVLDPFFGSGTTGLVAQKLNRKWIGIDCVPEYCQLAKERIGNTEIIEFKDNIEQTNQTTAIVPVETSKVINEEQNLFEQYQRDVEPEPQSLITSVDICPKCGTKMIKLKHGYYCPKVNCDGRSN